MQQTIVDEDLLRRAHEHAVQFLRSLPQRHVGARATREELLSILRTPLTQEGDLSAFMLSGMEKFLLRETERSTEGRKRFWKRDPSSREAYEKSVEPNRSRFRRKIGIADERLPIRELEYVGGDKEVKKITRRAAVNVLGMNDCRFTNVDLTGTDSDRVVNALATAFAAAVGAAAWHWSRA